MTPLCAVLLHYQGERREQRRRKKKSRQDGAMYGGSRTGHHIRTKWSELMTTMSIHPKTGDLSSMSCCVDITGYDAVFFLFATSSLFSLCLPLFFLSC